MSFSIACPNCEAKFQVPDELSGKRLKCKKCGEAFVARPADDAPAPTTKHKTRPSSDDDEPRRSTRATRPRDEDESDDEPRPKKKRSKKKAKTPVGLLIGVGVAAALLIGLGVFAAIYFSGDKKDPATGTSDISGGTSGTAEWTKNWVDYSAPDGSFTARLPIAPAVKTDTVETDMGRLGVKTYQSDAPSVVVEITCFDVPAAVGQKIDDVRADQILASAVAQLAKSIPGGTSGQPVRTTHQGRPARDVAIGLVGANAIQRGRVVLGDGKVLVILVRTKAGPTKPDRAQAVFDNLQLK